MHHDNFNTDGELQHYKNLFEIAPLPYQSLDSSGTIIEVNNAWIQALGYEKKEEVIGRWFGEFLTPHYKKLFPECFSHFKTVYSVSDVEFDMVRKDSSIINVVFNGTIYEDAQSGDMRTHCIFQDITQRLQVEEKLKQSLHEKEILIREINHRVKNNLQIISSLLSLHMNYEDKSIKHVLRECQNSIQSMALVHQTLYKTKNFREINVKIYVAQLVSMLTKSYKQDLEKISIDVDIENSSLDLNKAVYCGIIITELLSNSVKYAFPDGSAGTIRIRLKRNKAKKYVLDIEDDGVGFNETDITIKKTFGLELVKLLVEQMAGTFCINSKNGVRSHIIC